ncbi:hypothetical protein AK830_g6300 [Neonectria ditissima]|uniref:Uncharacterized protein n=1 Tax=Neonectria ditissima TaxID=78410 RepID=A0A0P7BIW8_9HYPO|nr:hypothetical protein AK830_g6300 [Neonectria ditissima]
MVPALPLSFAQLEQAALHVLHLIRNTRGLENTRLAVMGDLAVCKYLAQQQQHGRVAVKSIDLVISRCSSPGRVREGIVGHPMSPLVEKSGAVLYRHTSGWEVEVKLIPDWLCPYLPAAARPIREDIDTLPYVSLEDLFVFKVDACGLHERDASKQREAADAAALLELASEHSPLKLDDDKLDRVSQSLADIAEFSAPELDKSWWQRRLGMLPDEQKSAQEILSELSDHTQAMSSPTSPRASSNYSPSSSSSSSSISRSSSYMSSASGHSVSSSISRSSSYMSSVSAHSASSSISSVATIDEKQSDKNVRPRKMSLTNKTARHKRHPSTGGAFTKTTLTAAMQRLELDRPASPGMALTNQI